MKIKIEGLSRYLTDDEQVAEVIQHQMFNPELLLKMDMLRDVMDNSEERMEGAELLAYDIENLLGGKDVVQCFFALTFILYKTYKEIFTEKRGDKTLVK